MQNYSQNNEQLFIIKALKEKRNGVFLDIGANDGVTLSNTYALARFYGWVGLLVEASPKAYDRLIENYNKPEFNDRPFDFQNVAIGKEDADSMEFYESGTHLGNGDVGLVSTMVEAELGRWKDTPQEFTKITTPVTSVATMLSRSRHSKFDFLSIDIEGMELEVIPQIDFKSLGIKVACIEFNGKHEREFNSIMNKQGFRLIHKNMENLIYSK